MNSGDEKMVSYSLKDASRMKVYWLAALLSVAIVEVVSIWDFNVWGFDIKVPSAFLIYGTIFGLYDKYLWRLPVFKWLHDIPDLNKSYAVSVTQSVSGSTKEFEGFIKQTFTKIQIQIERTKSVSKVTSASLDLSTPGAEVLKYSYRHEPTVSDPKNYNYGDGFQTLFISEGRMQGPCFSTWCRAATVSLVPREQTQSTR